MARRKSQKNKKTPPKENNEVTLEILFSDCSNYVSWYTGVINAFRTVDSQLEQILDKSNLLVMIGKCFRGGSKMYTLKLSSL
jgi:hypothetical protein